MILMYVLVWIRISNRQQEQNMNEQVGVTLLLTVCVNLKEKDYFFKLMIFFISKQIVHHKESYEPLSLWSKDR